MNARACCACGAVLLWLLVCGWAAWQWRRRVEAQRIDALGPGPVPGQGPVFDHSQGQGPSRGQGRSAALAKASDAILVLHASQTGQAVELAEMTAGALRAEGVTARVAALDGMDGARLSAWPRVLFVASTYGEGDPPDGAAVFAGRVMAGLPDLRGMQYAVLALGDATYTHFCGFGRKLADWLRASGAAALFDTVEVDRADNAALRRWQASLARLAHDVADRDPSLSSDHGYDHDGEHDQDHGFAPGPAHGRDPDAVGAFFVSHHAWILQDRVHANPGSSGAPCYHLTLMPAPGVALPVWQAGDIAEILVPSADGLPSSGLPDQESLEPEPSDQETSDQESPGMGQLTSTVRRDYSIASLPTDGAIHLLVRQRHGADGVLGLGSGWLTMNAPPGATVSLRIRRHAAFHAPTDDVPMILIGNGTGIAGLRAHLKARAAAGRGRNWLLFGERNAASDRYYDAELSAWQADGVLTRLDRVYSRDGGARRYVQEALAAAATALREWVAEGAAIYVCGSVDGMAAGVDAVLRQTLGDEAVTALAHAGRYRRDVY
ncbi:sulfite reductase subunit alpha [Bordetella sp. LUAb4]|uniref:sulfite reductase subunit alpha n=1 Tax=Bordetella sp. LUAb4 TaxID=2843195 RepID=UPI001E40A081|nr:sulfite reductase subunit alpha [Bordetella sp. LUAb4]